MFVQSVGGYICCCCGVPLFIMLTGYLNINKKISRQYFYGGFRVLISYLFFSIITVLFRELYMHQHESIITWIHEILKFSAIPYAWYIEMWIGLFLLTPFLNKLYHGIESRRHKKLLIVILSIITFLPFLINRYGLHIIPGYWSNIYPLAFFYIGAYIREYNPIIRKPILIAIIMILAMINGTVTAIVGNGGNIIQIAGDSYGLLGAICSVAMFLSLYNLRSQSPALAKIASAISIASLDMYLCCFIMDQLVYPWFKERFFTDQSQFGAWFFVIIPILVAGAFIIAYCKDMLFKGVTATFRRLRPSEAATA